LGCWMAVRKNINHLNRQMEDKNDQIEKLQRHLREASVKLEKSEQAVAFLNKKETCATTPSNSNFEPLA